ITKQDANFMFDLAKRLALPEKYKLLEKIINRVKSENQLLLEANTVIFNTIENSKLIHDDKQQLHNLRIKRFTFFSYQVAISLIVDTENRFALHRQILADQYLDESFRKKLIDQFNKQIIPICLNIKQDQPQLYPQEYFQINNLIDTIIFENYQDLLVDGHIDHMIRNLQLLAKLKLQLHSKQSMIYFYFDYVRQINIADHEQVLLELRNKLSNDKILPSDLKNNLIQMIDKRISDKQHKTNKENPSQKFQPYQKKHLTNSESKQIDTELNQLISTRQQLLKEEPYTLKSSCYQPKSPSASV
ncbi:224_t:CDS:2, partial [Gigaspora rosea]